MARSLLNCFRAPPGNRALTSHETVTPSNDGTATQALAAQTPSSLLGRIRQRRLTARQSTPVVPDDRPRMTAQQILGFIRALPRHLTDEEQSRILNRAMADFAQSPASAGQNPQPPLASSYARPISTAVSHWYDESSKGPVEAQWRQLDNDQSMHQLARFLFGRHDLGTTNQRSLNETLVSNDHVFRQAVRAMLDELIKPHHAELRQQIGAIAHDGTQTCQDGALHTFQTMKKAMLVAAIQRGDYQHRLPELIEQARGQFRMDRLDTIASHKVRQLELAAKQSGQTFKEEREVKLGYLIALRERLNLPLDFKQMAYWRESKLVKADVDDAAQHIIEAERRGDMMAFLADWPPWHSLLERLMPTEYAAAKQGMHDDAFQRRLSHKLEAIDELMRNDPDVLRDLGLVVQQEMNVACYHDLSRRLLQTQAPGTWETIETQRRDGHSLDASTA